MENPLNIEEWIVELDIRSMQAAMESGETTSEEIVKAYLKRIERYDGKLKSIIEVNPAAVRIARELDDERYEKGTRGPLHGIPLLLKDNIDTRDAMHTSAGTLALAEHVAAEDSFVAAQLRKAGAVFLGKANMTEWANFMASGMWAGYSSRRGLCLNPYGPGELFVGGSSSGSGAAWRQTWRPRRSARKRPGRSSARPASKCWSASSRRSGWSAVRASFRSRTRRIRRTDGPNRRRCRDPAGGHDRNR
ncbi:Acylamidase [Paenibacillus sp. P1XP2]|nr:Acylamidase [Paenibacillus sp. P1XP2]